MVGRRERETWSRQTFQPIPRKNPLLFIHWGCTSTKHQTTRYTPLQLGKSPPRIARFVRLVSRNNLWRVFPVSIKVKVPTIQEFLRSPSAFAGWWIDLLLWVRTDTRYIKWSGCTTALSRSVTFSYCCRCCCRCR